jgi:prolipoprotein diacylglyceryltransferase
VVIAARLAVDRALGKEKRSRGIMSSLFMALYFTGRISVEYFKEYQPRRPWGSPPVNGCR